MSTVKIEIILYDFPDIFFPPEFTTSFFRFPLLFTIITEIERIKKVIGNLLRLAKLANVYGGPGGNNY